MWPTQPDADRCHAEVAIALMFACARKVVSGDKLVRRGGFNGWKPDLMLGQDVFGKKLGVIGRENRQKSPLCGKGTGNEIYLSQSTAKLPSGRIRGKICRPHRAAARV